MLNKKVNVALGKKGPAPKAPDSIYELLGLHSSMLQASIREARPCELRATLQASVMGTKYSDLNIHSAWQKARAMNPERLQPTGKVTQDDIRGEWTVFEKLNQWLEDNHKVLIEYGIAIDKPSIVNGIKCPITIPEDLYYIYLNFDETDHPFSNEGDNGGTRSTSYVDKNLP